MQQFKLTEIYTWIYLDGSREREREKETEEEENEEGREGERKEVTFRTSVEKNVYDPFNLPLNRKLARHRMLKRKKKEKFKYLM